MVTQWEDEDYGGSSLGSMSWSSMHEVLCYVSVVLAFKKQKQVTLCDLGASLI